ncbi:preprotein translocase subunit YajC [Rhizobiaceae bacterium]|nr:preprotein translocase subunit YajC [Rhizobiaceae bacterium]
MFITPAYAQTAGGAGGGLVELLFPIVIVGLIMWFLVINPQRKQAKARAEMLSNVRRNDTVVTAGGVVGKVTKVIDDSELEVQIAPDTRVRVLKSMLADVRTKGEPVKADAVETPEAANDAPTKTTRARIRKK